MKPFRCRSKGRVSLRVVYVHSPWFTLLPEEGFRPWCRGVPRDPFVRIGVTRTQENMDRLTIMCGWVGFQVGSLPSFVPVKTWKVSEKRKCIRVHPQGEGEGQTQNGKIRVPCFSEFQSGIPTYPMYFLFIECLYPCVKTLHKLSITEDMYISTYLLPDVPMSGEVFVNRGDPSRHPLPSYVSTSCVH